MRYPQFVDHIVFRIADLGKTEHFWTALLGSPPHRTPDSVMYQVGDSRLFFTLCSVNSTEKYDKERIGLNHVAFGVRTLGELRDVQRQLDSAGIQHSGIRKDQYGQKDFIWLDDPDGIRVEFYLRPL
jgi:glyoxylase I family protein